MLPCLHACSPHLELKSFIPPCLHVATPTYPQRSIPLQGIPTARFQTSIPSCLYLATPAARLRPQYHVPTPVMPLRTSRPLCLHVCQPTPRLQHSIRPHLHIDPPAAHLQSLLLLDLSFYEPQPYGLSVRHRSNREPRAPARAWPATTAN